MWSQGGRELALPVYFIHFLFSVFLSPRWRKHTHTCFYGDSYHHKFQPHRVSCIREAGVPHFSIMRYKARDVFKARSCRKTLRNTRRQSQVKGSDVLGGWPLWRPSGGILLSCHLHSLWSLPIQVPAFLITTATG